MIRAAMIGSMLLILSGCSSMPEWAGIKDPYTYGYRSYDPCIRCGEGWTFIPPSAKNPNQNYQYPTK